MLALNYFVGINPAETFLYFRDNISLLWFFVITISLWFIIDDENKIYHNLNMKYENEKNHKLKGWLVVIYCAFSMISPVVICYLL